MRITFAFISLIIILSSCGNEDVAEAEPEKATPMTSEDSLTTTMDSMDIKSEIDMSLVDKENRADFLEALVDIENQYGEHGTSVLVFSKTIQSIKHSWKNCQTPISNVCQVDSM